MQRTFLLLHVKRSRHRLHASPLVLHKTPSEMDSERSAIQRRSAAGVDPTLQLSGSREQGCQKEGFYSPSERECANQPHTRIPIRRRSGSETLLLRGAGGFSQQCFLL